MQRIARYFWQGLPKRVLLQVINDIYRNKHFSIKLLNIITLSFRYLWKHSKYPDDERSEKSSTDRHIAMTWAQRLKRVFNIDIETCNECGGAVKVIPKALTAFAGQALACIEDPIVIQKILSYLKKQKSGQSSNSNKTQISLLPDKRAPPVDS